MGINRSNVASGRQYVLKEPPNARVFQRRGLDCYIFGRLPPRQVDYRHVNRTNRHANITYTPLIYASLDILRFQG
jgi:hypothetical protein